MPLHHGEDFQFNGPSNQDACKNVTIGLGFTISERHRVVGRSNSGPLFSSVPRIGEPHGGYPTVPAGGSVTLTNAPRALQIMLLNLPGVNQDVCENKSFALTYSGSAHS